MSNSSNFKSNRTDMRKPKWKWAYFMSKYWTWKPLFSKSSLTWKDKYGTPRLERNPRYSFAWGFWTLTLMQGDDWDWEQWLWVYEYNDGDVDKARETWPWRNEDDESTWKDY